MLVRFVKIFALFIEAALIGLLALILGVGLVAVFFRYVMNSSLYWSDEVIRYMFVWMTFLGAALAVRNRQHIQVSYFRDLLPPVAKKTCEVASLTIVLLFNLLLFTLGVIWAWQTYGMVTPALELPLSLVLYAGLPIAAFASAVFVLQRLRTGRYDEDGNG